MPRIISVRSVLLSAPYSEPRDDLEVILHLPSGWRTTGLVEIKIDAGPVGLGEGYLAVFAPRVFEQIVALVAPVLVGRDLGDLPRLLRDVSLVTGYWSLQGAAQHVVSAVEIALQDCTAQLRGVPVWRLLGGETVRPLKLYASGGDCTGPEPMLRELDRIRALGIDLLKIRARHHQADKTRWCQHHGSARGVGIAVDMTQNLAIPSQSIDDVQRYLAAVTRDGGSMPVFLEEVFGPQEIKSFARLRASSCGSRIAGGEIVTTSGELCSRIEQGCYDIAQPDATVIGGLGATLDVFACARQQRIEVYVHCWGGPVGMMANYHAALAGGGTVAEWPIKPYALREAMLAEPWRIERGQLLLSDTPGLGVRLTPEIEREFPFREDAVYRCLVDPSRAPAADWR